MLPPPIELAEAPADVVDEPSWVPDATAPAEAHPPAEAFPPDAAGLPRLGLVCLSSDGSCAFRTVTRARYLATPPNLRERVLRTLYWANVQRLHWTLGYCARRRITLYRATSALFPMSDMPLGRKVLQSMPQTLASVGRRARALGIRLLLHPDPFVVLNSESRKKARVSRAILEKHALWFDLLGLDASPWNLMNLHGGKAGRPDQLVAAVDALGPSSRNRLTFENDEYSYSAADILDVCRRTGVPFVFDCHHHVIHDKLDSYDHPSVEYFTKAARDTWPDPGWQVCHVSNGHAAFRDRYHAEHITLMPGCFREVPWLEVEARGKEMAILALRRGWPASGTPSDGTLLDSPSRTRKPAAEADSDA